jgi:recombinational DNA repair ATPase RecF
VHLKTLTLRGFKSFASATTLRFEPGITCVVGPNGSGKSNVIDALAWVMGEQGAKTLRGGKMEDVIFAGTAGRPPLGRAEVVLTIDNTDGALPIEYAEVTISRIMFAGGGSEYAINGRTCRLLDVQELLSDSGIGREMHVIVGQGQLDGILHATPEERRGFIEEAAGVLKHRKRKEKALRKLDAMAANLTRLEDLTSELRRQLKPLGRQAELARRAVVIQADRRDARLRLLADDLLQLRLVLDREVADETALRARRTVVEGELATAQAREHELETATRELAPHLARTQETWYRLSSLRERVRGTASVARERSRNLADNDGTGWTTSDPDELDVQARAVRADEADVVAQLRRETGTLAAAETALAAAETALAVEDARLSALVRAAADRREGRARLVGQVDALRTRLVAAEAEIGRLVAARPRLASVLLERGGSSPHSRAASPGSMPASSTSTPSTSAPRPASPWPRSASSGSGTTRGPPSGSGPRSSPVRRRSGWAFGARTVPRPCSPPGPVCPAFWARSLRCSRSRPVGRARWPPPSARLLTQWLSTGCRALWTQWRFSRTTTPAGRRFSSARPLRLSCGRCSRAPPGRCFPTVCATRSTPYASRRSCTTRSSTCCPRSRSSRARTQRVTSWPPCRAFALSPVTATSSGTVSSPAALLPRRACWRSRQR